MEKTDILLISPNIVRETSNMSTNLQDHFLLSAIRETTDVDFEEIVGGALLKKIKSLIKNNDINKAEYKAYADLIDEAKYFLVYATITRIVVISSVKIDNMGLSQTKDEHINPLDMKDVFAMEDYYKNKTNYYKKKLQKYIIKRMDDYPELNKDYWYEIKANLYTSDSCNIFLGGARGKSAYDNFYSLEQKYEYL